MYFDAVLDKTMKPVFNGTPEETVVWLRDRPELRFRDLGVCIGKTMAVVSVNQYLLAVEEQERKDADANELFDEMFDEE